jgi:Amt family ammonium transporter
LCGTWGGIAAGLFGSTSLGGLGGVSLTAQLLGTLLGVTWALVTSFVLYALLKHFVGLRLSQEEEFEGADLSIHKINSSPDRETSW